MFRLHSFLAPGRSGPTFHFGAKGRGKLSHETSSNPAAILPKAGHAGAERIPSITHSMLCPVAAPCLTRDNRAPARP